jgi:hypothetical protein
MEAEVYDKICILTSLIGVILSVVVFNKLRTGGAFILILAALVSATFRMYRLSCTHQGSVRCSGAAFNTLFVTDIVVACVAVFLACMGYVSFGGRRLTAGMALLMAFSWVVYFVGFSSLSRYFQAAGHVLGVCILILIACDNLPHWA